MSDQHELESRQRQAGRLRWRCRRGMKELDVLLERYLENDFPGADDQEREAFEALLDCQDPELMAFFTGRTVPEDRATASVIARVRSFT